MSRAARLGAFILATLAILAIGIFIIGNKKYLFSDTYQIKAQFSNVVGLDVGAETRVGGVHRGTVHSIELPHDPTGKITVVMDMDSSTHDIVKKDSIASIETEGLLGNEYMAISFGTAGAGNVHDGDTITSQAPLEMADLMKKADGILDSSQDAMKSVTKATANISSITTKVDSGQGTIGALINDRQVYDHLDQTMAGMHDTIVQAQAGVTDFQENMEALKHNFFVRGYFKNRGYEDSSELAKDQIATLPTAAPLKTFTIDAKQLFDKQASAKLKNQKVLTAAGDFLSENDFGAAVIVAYTSMEGDTAKDLVLTQGRALVVREYLVENFSFDDTRVKTLGVGKKSDVSPATGWGAVQIVIYPPGTEIPVDAQPQVGTPSKITSNQTSPATTKQ
jgi:phospholipid/cholesterol/gamma-HCH transport system substrate-binding protein